MVIDIINGCTMAESLSVLFREAGFKNIKVCAKGETSIKNSTGLDLFERGKNSVYVGGSK